MAQMGRPTLRPGYETVHLSFRIDGPLHDLLVEYSTERGMSRSIAARSILRAHLATPAVAPTPIVKGRKRARHHQSNRPVLLPDAETQPTAFLAALRTPHVGRHAFSPGVAGVPTCTACGATPAEDVPCR
jgi:hypothetical protein